MTTILPRLADLGDVLGQTLGVSDWLTIDQARINLFADATDDHQWIHCDPERAAQGPFKTTVAHGFLSLSLLAVMSETAFKIADVRMGLNYGLNKVRFPAPVPVDSRVRGHFRLLALEPVAGGAQLTVEVTVELEGSAKPACVAEVLLRQFT